MKKIKALGLMVLDKKIVYVSPFISLYKACELGRRLPDDTTYHKSRL